MELQQLLFSLTAGGDIALQLQTAAAVILSFPIDGRSCV